MYVILDPYLLFANLGVVQRRSLNNPSVLDLVYENDENDINYRGMDLDMRLVIVQLKQCAA